MFKHTTYVAGCLGALIAAALTLAPAAAAGQEGMVAVRDPQTGQLRAPTQDELKALRNQGAALQAAPKPAPAAAVRRADGTLQMHLGENAMVYSVVTRDADGKLEQHCVRGEAAAGAATRNHQEHSHESE